LAAKWKHVFTIDEKKEKAALDESNQNQKSFQDKGVALTLIKKEPVTFFLSRKEDLKDFELMSFVIRACDKTSDKTFRTVLHVEQSRSGSRLVACDGIRLHVAEISKRIKSGDYKPHVTKDIISLGEPIEDIKYPVWSKVIPEKPEKRGIINLEKSGLGKDRKATEKLSIAFKSFVKQNGETINIRYLEDLTKQEWTVYSQKKRKDCLR
jgi:hypothetical protein